MSDASLLSLLSWSITVFTFSFKTIRSTFQRTGILHLFGVLKVRITQTKYLRREAGVEIMHLSPQTQGRISPPGHTATDSPLSPTFYSTHVAIFRMTLIAAEANDNRQVWFSLFLIFFTLIYSCVLNATVEHCPVQVFLKICYPPHLISYHIRIGCFTEEKHHHQNRLGDRQSESTPTVMAIVGSPTSRINPASLT